MHDREAANRAGTEGQQGYTGDQGGHVRVENRVEGALVTG